MEVLGGLLIMRTDRARGDGDSVVDFRKWEKGEGKESLHGEPVS